MILLLVHIIPSNIIPSRKSVHSYTLLPTGLEAYIQLDSYIGLPSSNHEHVFDIFAAAR
jgi:hypothetical protein